ncbi:MAG: pirin family protein [Xenococcaceae cyanobacterium]
MLTIRPAGDRGHAYHGWLDSYHTFSFANYYDPKHMGFRDLRVINEDRVAPGMGFGRHSHRDMEIITFVLEGAVEHKDSIGNIGTIKPGEVQRMSAGTGIQHSEYNPSDRDFTHLLQIWILPDRQGIEPSYEQVAFPLKERLGKLRLIASPDGRDGAVTIHQNVELYTAVLEPGNEVSYVLKPDRHAWLQVTKGEVTVNSHNLKAGDGVAICRRQCYAIALEKELTAIANTEAEILLFDLA